MGFGSILDDVQPMLLCQRVDLRHGGWVAVEMDGHDRLGARCDQTGCVIRVDAPGEGIHIGKNRRGARVVHGIGAGNEGQAGHDDFVTRTEAQRVQGEMEGHRAIADADAVPHAAEACEILLEASYVLAQAADPSAAHRIEHVFFFAPVE